ncbi:MAG: alpha/beta fold hydrolase [Rubrobacteraceae bacterium]
MTEQRRSVPIAFSEYGRGEPIILLHAFPLNCKMWSPQARALSESHRVIMPDYPGFGRSPYPPAQPDMRFYAERIRELLDKLELERVILGGLSMGGYVAFACLKLFSERVSGLLLANTRPEPDAEEIRENRKNMAQRVSEEGVGVLIELQMERLLSSTTLQNEPLIVEQVKTMILESSPDGVVGALGAMRDRKDATPLLPGIQVPTLVIGGEEDGISSPEVMAAMSERIPDSEHHTLSGAAHLSNLEAPGDFNAALKEFLKQL